MALINCPECGVMVSDKAYHCPKCAYPISNFVPTQSIDIKEQIAENKMSNNNSHENDVNIKTLLLISNRKSEGLAILFVLIFGPFGLFYTDSSKAIKLILLMAAVMVFLAVFIAQKSEDNYLTFCAFDIIIFWIISLTQVSDTVKNFNESLIKTTSQEGNTTTFDEIDELDVLINQERRIPFYAPSKKEEIIELLEKICIDEEQTIHLINEYGNRYQKNLIKELISLSTNKLIKKQYIYLFEKYNILDSSLLN